VRPNISYGGVQSPGLGIEATLKLMQKHFTRKKTIMI